eukprot:366054-Pleurochrysis_carterae.AAC.4
MSATSLGSGSVRGVCFPIPITLPSPLSKPAASMRAAVQVDRPDAERQAQSPGYRCQAARRS